VNQRLWLTRKLQWIKTFKNSSLDSVECLVEDCVRACIPGYQSHQTSANSFKLVGVICGSEGLNLLWFELQYSVYIARLSCILFTGLSLSSAPILKVALFPARTDSVTLKRLTEGLNLLWNADLNVQVAMEAIGENVIIASADLHLDRWLMIDRSARRILQWIRDQSTRSHRLIQRNHQLFSRKSLHEALFITTSMMKGILRECTWDCFSGQAS
jgi:hypothetical protein